MNHMIRLKGVGFTSSQSGPQQRELRRAASGPYAAMRARGSGLSFMSEDMHNEIMAACDGVRKTECIFLCTSVFWRARVGV